MKRRPPNREELIQTVQQALARHPEVQVAYLYGSAARGTATPLSDVDVAVLPPADVGEQARGSLHRRLLASLGTALPGLAVDVRLFDDLPLAVRGRVLRDGRRIVDRDPVRRVRMEVRTLMEYHDFLHFERTGAAQWATAVRERSAGG